MPFHDREHAAHLLSQRLMGYRGQRPLVLGIPRCWRQNSRCRDPYVVWDGHALQSAPVSLLLPASEDDDFPAVEMDLDAAAATGDSTARRLRKAVEEFHTYMDHNRAFIANYGERYRYGERSAPAL
jgi:hypothetical protein